MKYYLVAIVVTITTISEIRAHLGHRPPPGPGSGFRPGSGGFGGRPGSRAGAPGSRCTGVRECAGAPGSVRCVANVCTCVPPATSNGRCCVGGTGGSTNVSSCVGPCVNGACSTGYSCNTAFNLCCPAILTCPNGALSLGPCNNGACITGFACNPTINSCCPSCPNNAEVAGACLPGGACGTGLTCINGFCCRGTAGDGTVSTTTQASTSVCIDGSPAAGACFDDGTCGDGHVCVQGQCCFVPVKGPGKTPAKGTSGRG